MRNKKTNLFTLGIALITVLTGFSAKASVLIEPHLGYALLAGGNSNSINYKYNGAQYGMRLGGQMLGFMAGLDYNISSYTWAQTPGGDDTFTRKELGIFAGYNLPLLVRAWGAYYFTNSAKDTNASGRTGVGAKYTGNTKEIGAGFTGFPFISLNVVFRNVTMDTLPTTITGSAISNNELVLGVSAPFNLL